MSPRELQKRLATIRKMEHGIQPDAAWVFRDREKLLARVRSDFQTSSQSAQSVPQVLKELYQSFLPTEFIATVRGPAIALLSGLAVVLSGSIASVSAAERAVPGDLLYPVKIAAEQTRLVFASGKTDKIRLKTEFVTRRVEEIRRLNQVEPKEPARIKEAAENLKRDLDTVKNQLTDTKDEEPVDRTKAAKIVDEAGTSIVASLKEMKITAAPEARSQIAEAEAAAVNTSVKAVQVILETQSDAESQKVVSREALILSITAKVDGVEGHIADTTQQLANAVSSTTVPLLGPSSSTTASTTSSLSPVATSTTSSLPEIATANASLKEAKQLLSENKIEEATNKLVEVNRDAVTAEKKVEQITANMSSTTSSGLPPPVSTSTATTTSALPPEKNASTTATTTESKIGEKK